MNSDESPTQKPQETAAADGELNLSVHETEYQLPSQIPSKSIALNKPAAQFPPETDPWAEEEAEIADEADAASAIDQIQPETDDRSFESALAKPSKRIDQIEPETDSQPTATAATVTEISENVTENVADRVQKLLQQEQNLTEKIAALEADKAQALEALSEAQSSMGRLVQDGLIQLDKRKQTLQIEIEKLERRRDRIQKEMRTTFAGVSQDLAIRVQGFKDYLVGSLQDLAATAELLDLTPPIQETPKQMYADESESSAPVNLRFAEPGFQEQTKQIRRILDQYRTLPDYYGPAWQLRRTFEPIHAERVSNWFFTQGGRGALRTMGSRLQNILITSAIVSVLRSVYGARVRTLVLANTPERLGEWRRGLQDCLGITRSDFGPERGIIMFESPEALAQKADRLVKDGNLPLIAIDETEDLISLSMLQFPLWLAFAPDPQSLMVPKDF
ncbi:DUF3086 domain-containing protein [Tychonema sp. LEGE 07199]|uniref:DUF3086 domain-containing protein n=1 Tax=unclassified Tychonema TaxID=2642144 RepID=UPI001880203A|nr:MULTISPECIES: DUF3086 domain-containing protein [unclassified Tychonema]MBE9122935.1 DUF3086 domain-containing protein [Tychonema sp. LEGE 07199]MBE9130606.1 DUF3086 domain-containing protein [Tychonema sp. LEGE 07196]